MVFAIIFFPTRHEMSYEACYSFVGHASAEILYSCSSYEVSLKSRQDLKWTRLQCLTHKHTHTLFIHTYTYKDELLMYHYYWILYVIVNIWD